MTDTKIVNTNGMAAKDRIIVALDVSDMQSAEKLVRMLGHEIGYFKVGMELYYSVGPAVIDMIKAAGSKVFLDLKLHDIPNTVAQGARAIARTGADMINVHAAGGCEMMQKTAEALAALEAETGKPRPKLIAVTVLTSLDQRAVSEEVGLSRQIREQVQHWAGLAQQSGLDGVVASPQELSGIREVCGPDFITVIPGVRPAWADQNDQKRIMTPGEAVAAGATHLVIGRPITRAADPRQAVEKIIHEIEEALL
jgi:orotidine-5'-phosphate decarboxylase